MTKPLFRTLVKRQILGKWEQRTRCRRCTRVGGWNHNTHYHRVLLAAMPPQLERALDVGCGLGGFARELAAIAGHVDAIDCDAGVIARAIDTQVNGARNVHFRCADFMTSELADYDAITMIAALHHMPLRAAVAKARAALRPGGVFGVIGLYKTRTLAEWAASAIALPASHILRRVHVHATVGAPVHDPEESLAEIRDVARELLPGVTIERHLFWRYTLRWRKP